MQKRVSKSLIIPVGIEDFGGPSSEMTLKMIKKHYPERFPQRVFKTSESLVNPTETLFLESQKCVAETLIKPAEIQDFWRPFSKIVTKMIGKALPREGCRNEFSKRWEPL